MFKAYLKWFLVNGLFASLFFYGNIYENENIINIPIFFAWLASILSLFLLSDDGFELYSTKFKNGKKFVHKKVDFSFDMLMLFSFIYYGYFFLSVFYFIHAAILYTTKTRFEEEQCLTK